MPTTVNEEDRNNPVWLRIKLEEHQRQIQDLKQDVKDLRDAIREMDHNLEKREAARAEKERNVLLTGIKTLIWFIGIMAGVIWAYRAIIIGSPPSN